MIQKMNAVEIAALQALQEQAKSKIMSIKIE